MAPPFPRADAAPRDVPATGPAVPDFLWWILAAVGLGVRVGFVLRGNIAFNSDEAHAGLWLRQWLENGMEGPSPSSVDFAGLRLAGGYLFYVLTGGWVYFTSLASIFFSGFFSAVWVFWVHQKISKGAALGAALFFALPPVCVAYYSTHLERRIATLLWASLLVAFSGSWLRKNGTALLGGVLVGWAFWNEPFILFFALPVAAYELRLHQTRGGGPVGRLLAWAAAGLLGGGVAGNLWNAGFKSVYCNASLAGWKGIGKNLALLCHAFPQYWNGNFPFGYLQASAFGQWLDPVRGGGFAVFAGFWTFATLALAVGGCVALARGKGAGGAWLSALVWAPALLYFLFFVFNAQVWDATSFRYLDYWVVFAALGGGLAFQHLFRWRRRAAVFAVSLFVLVQGFLLVQEFRRLPAEFPVVRIVQNLERLGFKLCLANHWVAEAGTYLSGGRVFMTQYKFVGDLPGWQKILAGRRIGLVVLKGLDNDRDIENTVHALAGDGFRYTKTWPMLGEWFVLEFHKEGGSVPGAVPGRTQKGKVDDEGF